MDCTVHGVAKSRTWLSNFHFQDLKSPPRKTLFLTEEHLQDLGIRKWLFWVATISLLPCFSALGGNSMIKDKRAEKDFPKKDKHFYIQNFLWPFTKFNYAFFLIPSLTGISWQLFKNIYSYLFISLCQVLVVEHTASFLVAICGI